MSVTDALLLASNNFPMQSAMFNPIDGRLVAIANAKDGVQLYDVRRLNKFAVIFFSLSYCANN